MDHSSSKSATSSHSSSATTIAQSRPRLDSFVFANGDRYEGEYIVTDDGQMIRHGQGKHIRADEQLIYQGTWQRDKMHGAGRLSYGNGTSYDGDFHSNYFQGLGTYTWADGAQYTGIWQRSKPLGKAEYTEPHLGVTFVGKSDGQEVHMRYKVSSF